MTTNAAQIGDLILQIGDSVLLTLKPFFQGTELCLNRLGLLVLQCNDFAAVVADLLFMRVESGLDPLDDVEQVIVLASESALVSHQPLVGLLYLVL